MNFYVIIIVIVLVCISATIILTFITDDIQSSNTDIYGESKFIIETGGYY